MCDTAAIMRLAIFHFPSSFRHVEALAFKKETEKDHGLGGQV